MSHLAIPLFKIRIYYWFVSDTTAANIRRTFDVNVLSHFHTVRAFLPSMISANMGHIVTVSSVCAYLGFFSNAHINKSFTTKRKNNILIKPTLTKVSQQKGKTTY